MNLFFKQINNWPKLAWVAYTVQGSNLITVLHGPNVETGKNWFAEAVWAGDFKKGDFDKTDLIFGSGVRCRDEKATFVSSGTTLDRLYYCNVNGSWYVSNSLPALLACSKISLNINYQKYTNDIRSIEKGLNKYQRVLPAKPENINLSVFHNLIYDGKLFKELAKPDSAPSFKTYDDYYKFLIESANSLQRNFNHPARHHKILPLASISSGYDSPAAAVIARHAGCHEAVTIMNASSISKKSDSGDQIAKALNMNCKIYRNMPNCYNNEITFWAAAGVDLDLNLSVFDYPEPLCIFFTGFNGDRIWDRTPHSISNEIEWGGPISGYGFSEFRLHEGIFHCVVPFWGVRHTKEIYDITLSDEMKNWSLMNDYDRPIARRIIEDENVPRSAFGYRKAFTARAGNGFYWPHSKKENRSFRGYLKGLQIESTSPVLVKLYRCIAPFALKVTTITSMKRFDPRLWFGRFKSKTNSLLFQWANTEMKKQYEECLRKVSIPSGIN
jgi:hypothetical protein